MCADLGIHKDSTQELFSIIGLIFLVLTPQDLFDGSNLCVLETSQKESKRSFFSWYLSAVPILGLFYFWHCLQSVS